MRCMSEAGAFLQDVEHADIFRRYLDSWEPLAQIRCQHFRCCLVILRRGSVVPLPLGDDCLNLVQVTHVPSAPIPLCWVLME